MEVIIMSSNYNQILDQFVGLAKFGKQAYKSGQLSQEEKDKLRKEIFSFNERVNDEISLTHSLQISRSLLESYIHNFGNPTAVPDFIMNHLDDLTELIVSVDTFTSKQPDDNLADVVETLSQRWIRTASKLLRISYVLKDAPLQLPHAGDLIGHIQKGSAFD